MNETDVRVQMLSSFLSTPHGKIAELAPLHVNGLAGDPLFYGHLAVWYTQRGEVRDHRVLFVAHLLTSEFPELREVGWVLLQKLPPHMVARALDHAKQAIGKVPRMFKSAITAYLRGLEQDAARFDRAALRGRNDLKHLYASLRIAPSARVQAILFDERPPEDSTLYWLKLLALTTEPAEQAQFIVEHRIPYPIAVGALTTISPAVLVALVDVMTPQETINHLASLKKRGAFDHPELKKLVEEKLQAAQNDRRVSTLKATRALAHVALDEQTEELLTSVTDQRIAQIARISRPTALFVDKSSSMTEAIEVAKEVAALVGAICSDFVVVAFDDACYDVRATGSERSDWEKAFRLIRANGATSIGAPLAKLTSERKYVEQVVIITDMQENTAPMFHDAYARYVAELGIGPDVTVVAVGGYSAQFEKNLKDKAIPHTIWTFDGDYYALPNLLPLLAMPNRAEMVAQIMAVPLPQR